MTEGSSYHTRLRIIKRMCSVPMFSLSVGSKETRMANINLDIDVKSSPDIVGTAAYLPFKDKAFERILFSDVIEHLPSSDEIPALREICRVLKVGGELILSTPNDVLLYTILDVARYIMTHRHYKKDYICYLLENCGFEIESGFTAGGYWDCLNNLWYCLIVYPLNRIFNLKLPFAPQPMLALADKQYEQPNGQGYTIFVKGRKRNV